MPDTDTFNLIANVATVTGGALVSGLIIYILVQVWRINERLESVLAPKGGIESHLQMCERVVECAPDGICLVADQSKEIVLVNSRFEQMSGYHRSELVGKPVEIMVPDRYKDSHPAHTERYLMNPSNRPMRGLSFKHKRGHEISAGIWLGHFSDPSGGYTIVLMRAGDGERVSQEMPVMGE